MSGSDTADLQIRAPSRKRSWVRWALVGLVIAEVVGVELFPRAARIMPGMRGIDMFVDYPLLEDADLIERIDRIEAEAHGVRYLDLMAYPELRDRKDYHEYEYYLPYNRGSRKKGKVPADYILDNYPFSQNGS